VFVLGDVEVQDVEVVLGVQLVRDAHERRTSGLGNSVVDDHQLVVVTTCR